MDKNEELKKALEEVVRGIDESEFDDLEEDVEEVEGEGEESELPEEKTNPGPPIQRNENILQDLGKLSGLAAVSMLAGGAIPVLAGCAIASGITIYDAAKDGKGQELTKRLSILAGNARKNLSGVVESFSNGGKSPTLPPDFELDPPMSDFTKSCFMGDIHAIQEFFDSLKDKGIVMDWNQHDYKHAVHYAAYKGYPQLCKLLIQNGADCSVELNGKKPQELASTEIVRDCVKSFSLLQKELDILVGLSKVKRHVYQMTNKIILDKRRRKLSNLDHKFDTSKRHMVILGNPGTGKTRLARLIARLYYEIGICKKNIFVEVQRSDLCGEFVGKTGPKTRNQIRKASGGVLFVDEAYRLSQSESNVDYGPEAIDEIMAHMNMEGPDRTIFIFAGYPLPMQKFIKANPGLFRRIDFKLHFDDYTPTELANIVLHNVNSSRYHVDVAVTSSFLSNLIEQETKPELRAKMNGGLAEKIVEFAIQHQNDTLSLEASDDELCRLNRVDFEKACEMVCLGGVLDDQLTTEVVKESLSKFQDMKSPKDDTMERKRQEEKSDLSQSEFTTMADDLLDDIKREPQRYQSENPESPLRYQSETPEQPDSFATLDLPTSEELLELD